MYSAFTIALQTRVLKESMIVYCDKKNLYYQLLIKEEIAYRTIN